MSADLGPDTLDVIAGDWARVRPDLDVSPMLTVIALVRANAFVQGELDAFFEVHGVTAPGFDVLAALHRSSPREGTLLTHLGRQMAISAPAVTKRVDALEARGLVERAPDPADRRAFRLRLTDAGRAVVERLMPLHVANEARALSALSSDERATLTRLLTKLTDRHGRG